MAWPRTYRADTTPPSPSPSTVRGTIGFAAILAKVKPVLAPVRTGCHGGGENAGAKNAMDLCLQVRAHVNFQTQSRVASCSRRQLS